MGIGSVFLFINATPWPFGFIESKNTSYQMTHWRNWPSIVEPGQSWAQYIEDSRAVGHNAEDDGGNASYTIGNRYDRTFDVSYHADSGDNANLRVKLNVPTLGKQDGITVPLFWQHGDKNYDVPFILASSDTDLSTATFISNKLPQDWMASTYDRISCLTVRELAMPGTHDSGMSEFHGGIGDAAGCNTETQNFGIYRQLYNGARHFDIRPFLTGGGWWTGHFGWSKITTYDWRGGYGQSMTSIINEINNFTASYNELIVLRLSHAFTDDFKTHMNSEGPRFTQEDWNRFMTQLLRINHLVKGVDSSTDLTKLQVSYFIENRPAVIVVIDDNTLNITHPDQDGPLVNVSSFVKEGIFFRDQFPLTSKWSDSDDEDDVVNDQLDAMKKYRTDPRQPVFLLNWALTKQGVDNICIGGLFGAITDFAIHFNNLLFRALWETMASNTYPNIIAVDGFQSSSDIAALAVAINYHFAPKCTAPGSDSKTTSPTTPPCGAGLQVCNVQDPTRLEAPWAGVSSPFPQCYDPAQYTCSENFLCPIGKPKIKGQYACGPAQVPQPPCGNGLLICDVEDPTRLEAPWAGVFAPFPQCYDLRLYTCSDNFLCPINAPKIQGEYACGPVRNSQVMAQAILCGLGYC